MIQAMILELVKLSSLPVLPCQRTGIFPKLTQKKTAVIAMKTLSYFFFLILLPSFCLPAEELKQPGPLSLQECIAIALNNNIDVLTAQNDVVAAKSRSTKAKSSYFPQLSVQNNLFSFGSDGVLNKTTTGTALSVNQNIYDGGLREANIQGARYGVIQNQTGLTRTTQTVVFNVTQAYYEMLRARQLAEVAQSNVNYNEGLREQVKTRVDLGDAANVDILPVEAQLASAQVALLSAQNSVRTSAIQLQNVMGVSPESDFDIQEINDPPTAEVEQLDNYMGSALKSRPDILQSQAGVGAAKAAVKSSRIPLYPYPSISGQYQRGLAGGFNTSGTQIVGGINFNIFDGKANRAAYREAQANRANAELQAQQIGRTIHLQVEEAYLNLTNAKERMAVSAVSLDAATKNYEVQKERYAQGLGIMLDMLNAEVQVVNAQADVVQARYDYYIALAQMDYAVGK
jgi:TolC family type I secretion outer membrane protein